MPFLMVSGLIFGKLATDLAADVPHLAEGAFVFGTTLLFAAFAGGQ
jgi:hypothetical protein